MSDTYSPVSEQYPGGIAKGADHTGDGAFATAVGAIGRTANSIAVLFTLALAAVFIYEIVARVVFNRPTGFANQLSAYGMPFIAYLAAARTLASDGHVSVDFFVLKLRPAARTKLEIGTDAFSVVLLAAITCIAFAVVLEAIPRELAAQITRELRIPTIGIGAGPDCDAQVLVWQDMAGLRTGKLPRFVKRYADLTGTLTEATRRFAEEVRGGDFPAEEHTF